MSSGSSVLDLGCAPGGWQSLGPLQFARCFFFGVLKVGGHLAIKVLESEDAKGSSLLAYLSASYMIDVLFNSIAFGCVSNVLLFGGRHRGSDLKLQGLRQERII
ncbi:hypothetical protein glysoja_013444 [Glycine soja]|nr:hypothetical protein glysoja_013444 [Glycine soja]